MIEASNTSDLICLCIYIQDRFFFSFFIFSFNTIMTLNYILG